MGLFQLFVLFPALVDIVLVLALGTTEQIALSACGKDLLTMLAQLVLWRKAWADSTNTHLERAGADARIDHRSHAERGLDEQPTIHEGVVARALEKKGIVADRCEINRQIKADNALLRELKATVKKLMQAVKNTLPVMAEKLETLRQNMIIFRYQLQNICKNFINP